MNQESTLERFAEHAHFARRLARSLLRDEGAAEDVSQEAWRVALERGPTGIGDFRAWLGGVVRNLARTHLRGEAARRRREAHRAREAARAGGDSAARLDQIERLVLALKRLREPFRSVVLLRYEAELPPREIARRTGVPVGTVKSRLRRGLDMLREDLRETHGGDDRAWRAGMAVLLVIPGRRSAPLVALAATAVVLLGLGGWWLAAPDREPVPAPAPATTAAAAGWLPEPSRIAAVRVPAAAPSTAPGRSRVLRLLDAATGEPLPDFVVAAPALDPPLRVTGPAGELTLEARDEVLELRLIDDPRLPRDEPVPAELHGEVLKVRVGPTYHLTLAPPLREQDRFEARLASLDRRREHRTSFAPVRGDGEPWVRFGARAGELGAGPPWRLEVRSDDGYRFGEAEVRTAAGVHPGRVFVEMRLTGGVAGRVRAGSGSAVDQARLELSGEGRSFVAASDSRGRFEFLWIPPGSYELVAGSRLHHQARNRVEVQPDSTAEVELVLPIRRQGEVAGRLRTAGGHPLSGPVTLVLTDLRDPERTFLTTLTPAAQDRAPAPGAVLCGFRFAGVPLAGYELTVRASDFVRWSPARLRVTPPEAEIEIVRRDDEPADDLCLRAVDDRTGEPLPTFDAFVRLPGELESGKVLAASGGELWLRRVPVDSGLELVVRAPGYAAANGDRTATSAPLRLRRGWSNSIRVVDRRGGPVSGVRLVIDGVATAASAPDGGIEPYRPDRPERIALAPGAFVLAGGDVFRDGGYRDLLWGITVVVEPRDPEKKR